MTVHTEPPRREARRSMALECSGERRDAVGERSCRDHAAWKLARQRVAAEHSVCGVGERLTRTEDAARVWRHEPEATADRAERSPDCRARGDDATRHEGATREIAHRSGSAAPVIIARTRARKPATTIIATCTSVNATSAMVTTKCSVRAD